MHKTVCIVQGRSRLAGALVVMLATTGLWSAGARGGPVDLDVSAADFNADGAVNVQDFMILAGNYGTTEAGFWCQGNHGLRMHMGQHHGDANRDGRIGVEDFNVFAREFGRASDTPIPPIRGVGITAQFLKGNSTDLVVVDRPPNDSAHTYSVIDTRRMSINRGKFWWSVGDVDALEPTFVMTPRPDGFDLCVTYANASTRVRNCGLLRIGGMLFDDGLLHERIFGTDDAEQTLTGTGASSFYARATKYAPVCTLRGTTRSDQNPTTTREHVIGISVQYPIMEYQHGVSFRVKREPATFAVRPYWLEIGLNRTYSSPNFDNRPAGDIAPGQTRTYTISVRIMATDTPPTAAPAHPNDYLYLFQEYRRFFKRLYGEVRYTRDSRPVNGYKVAGMEGAVANNWGFNPPQLHLGSGPAWTGWIDRLENAERRGFDRFMMWGSSGVAVNAACVPTGLAVNYPFQFTTNWDAVSGGNPNHPIIKTQAAMRAWASAPGRQLGFWWGNSSRPLPWGTCDVGALPALNLCDSAQTTGAAREVGDPLARTGVHALGVSAVGLDAMSSLLRPEDAYVWIQQLVVSNPSVKFVSEPSSIDVVHTVAPTFQGAYQPNAGVGPIQCYVTSTNAMADFLNQGHEQWAHILALPPTPDCGAGVWASALTDEKLKLLMKSVADKGFVPVVCGASTWEDGPYRLGDIKWHLVTEGPNLLDPLDLYTEADFEADLTWNTSVPSGLRRSN